MIDVHYKLLIENKQEKIVQELEETHPMRYFSIPEIELLSSINDFEFLHTEEFMTSQKPSEDTWGVNFILRKNYDSC